MDHQEQALCKASRAVRGRGIAELVSDDLSLAVDVQVWEAPVPVIGAGAIASPLQRAMKSARLGGAVGFRTVSLGNAM